METVENGPTEANTGSRKFEPANELRWCGNASVETAENGRPSHANATRAIAIVRRPGVSRLRKNKRDRIGLAFCPALVRVIRVMLVFENLTERFIHLVPEEAAPVGNPAEHVIKAGNDQDTDHGAHEHPADSRGANGAVSDRPGAGGEDQRKETGDEGEGGHLNRPEAQFSSFDGRLLEGQALPAPLHREFDDQDRVLAEQTDQHDQTNLGVDVVGQPHDLQEQEGTEDPDRQRQDHGQRQDETLVLPDQYQIDEGDDDQEDINRLVPLFRLVVREAFPADAVTVWQRLAATSWIALMA